MAQQPNRQADVLIIGSGAAGVAASIEARERGASVVVLEREAFLGGAAAISGGGCCLVGTELQRRNSIEDSTELAFADWVKFGQGAADEVWARFYIENSNQELYEWALARGVEWSEMNHQEGNTVPRWQRPPGGGGALWNALYQTALRLGVNQWITSTAAQELQVSAGRVVGVRAKNTESGQVEDYYAKSVVVSTGGFASNLDMVLEHRPDLRANRILEGSHVGATGSGHQMLEQVQAYFTHMNEIWFYSYAIPDHRDPNQRRGLVIRGLPNAVWINQQGQRFHNEGFTGGFSGTRAVMAQEPPHCWAVIDSSMSGAVTVSDPNYYQEGVSVNDPDKVSQLLSESPHIKRGDSLEELATEIGVPPASFRASLDRYNSFIAEGLERDPDYGRSLSGRRPIQDPPYYAFNFFPLARKNFGGVKTDLRCRVLDHHFQPIPGLFAGGEVAGMAGGHINGKAGLEGTMLGPSLFSGRVAGAWAAQEAGYGEGFQGTGSV